jgi:cleavage and polyadenylation specificity factor subunit 6/7
LDLTVLFVLSLKSCPKGIYFLKNVNNSKIILIENLMPSSKSEIHGQNPVVTPCNRQNLNHFEMQSRKTAPGGPGGGPQHVGGQQNFVNQRTGFGGQPQSGGMRPPLIQRPVRPNGPLLPGQPRMQMPHQGMPFGSGQPQWGPGMGPNGPPRPPAPIHPGAPPMANMPLMRLPPQPNRGPIPQQPLLRGPSTQNDPRTQMAPGGPMPDWANDHAPHGHGPPGPQNMVMTQPGQPQSNASMPPRGPQNEYTGFDCFLF